MKALAAYLGQFSVALVLGFLADALSNIDNNAVSGLAVFTRFGFFLTLPAAYLVLVGLVELLRLHRRGFIVVLGIAVFVGAMILTYWFFDFRNGYRVSDMYGIFYLFGALPALLIGLVFGSLVPRPGGDE